jgi:dynein heavy chain
MMERKKFGPKGFNMVYAFSLGDLRDSAVCLSNYMENAPVKVPWPDLRYIFGQIMYGGHIVNDFDRTLCTTYLDCYMREELLDEMELFPFTEDERGVSFKTPSPTTYDRYLDHVELELKGETPLAFGLHPNAEIGFRTDQSAAMFRIIMELQPRSSGGDDSGMSPQHVAENILNDVLDRFGETRFDTEEMGLESRGPFQNVFIQECDTLNRLLGEMSRSLLELNLGFAGELTMSDSMEQLMDALYMDRVPSSWEKLAWPSGRNLALWLHNLGQRLTQLADWFSNPMEVPKVTWLSGLVNPQSFLTAVKQRTAQQTKAELDKLCILTEVTKRQVEDVDVATRDGCLIHGLSLEGARWDVAGNIVERARPKEMFCPMPVINCKAVPKEKGEGSGVYQCPVYKTEQRGPTFVFCAQLKTKSPPARWVLAGVALIMDVVE